MKLRLALCSVCSTSTRIGRQYTSLRGVPASGPASRPPLAPAAFPQPGQRDRSGFPHAGWNV